jgi:hypothetical protein
MKMESNKTDNNHGSPTGSMLRPGKCISIVALAAIIAMGAFLGVYSIDKNM